MADEEDQYACISGGSLKLKGGKVKKSKKKKKKNKAKEILEEAGKSQQSSDEESSTPSSKVVVKKTAAELAFEKAQEKRAAERILGKASKTHKQRVEELNDYLGGLSEHYDVQKVSWTK